MSTNFYRIHSILLRKTNDRAPSLIHLVARRFMASSNLTVQHDNGKKSGEFFIEMEGVTEKAVLQYEWAKPDVMDMYHTGTPPAFRGRGIAKILAQHAMDYVVEKDLKFIPTCSYIEKFVRDNPSSEFAKKCVQNP